MIESRRLKNLISMFGYNSSCSKVLSVLLKEDEFYDVNEIVNRTGYSRSMVSYILKKLAENGIVLKERSGHKYLYKVDEKFLINMYSIFMKKLERELKFISDEKNKFNTNFYNQIEIIKNNIKNLKGEIKWQML